jgi:molybdopterin synthase sulfur carrier subunit
MAADSIQIQIKLFAIYQEVVGTPQMDWQTSIGTTAGQVLAEIIGRYPQLAAWQSVTRLGVNLQFVPAATVLIDGDELVLIPPVSGG